jgi:DNA ligase (NAD+)
MTGSLSLPRDEYKKRLYAVGAKLVSNVTKNTDFLVCNEASNSSKYKDAVKLATKIINEETFLRNLPSLSSKERL